MRRGASWTWCWTVRATKAVLTWNLSDRYVDPPDEWKLQAAGLALSQDAL